VTPTQARKKFAATVKRDGEALVSVRICCSTTQVRYIAEGKRNPGLQIAAAIEEAYKIPMRAWATYPASRKVI
jgi:hypothetical protein